MQYQLFSLNSYALLSLDIIGVIPDITWLPERKFVTVFSTAPDLMLHQMLQITLRSVISEKIAFSKDNFSIKTGLGFG